MSRVASSQEDLKCTDWLLGEPCHRGLEEATDSLCPAAVQGSGQRP